MLNIISTTRRLLMPIYLLFFTFISSTVVAEEYTPEPQEEQFQIEYLIFTHKDQHSSEQNSGLSRYKDSNHTQRTHLVEGFEPLSAFQFPKLGKQEMILKDVLTNLTISRDVNVLSYGAWRQEIPAESSLPPISIDKLIEYESISATYRESRLEGWLTFKRSRYMHVDAELFISNYHFFQDGTLLNHLLDTEHKPFSISWFLTPYTPNEMLLKKDSATRLPSQVKKLIQSRRLKYGEIHYLDHPDMGMIVTINKFEPESVDDY